MPKPPKAEGRIGILPRSIAGGLAYFTFIPALIFLFTDPYRRDPFVRFHSVQCLLFWLSAMVVAALLRLVAFVVYLVPVVGALVVWLISPLFLLAAFFLWLVLVVKALQGEAFRLPVLGDFAAHFSGTV